LIVHKEITIGLDIISWNQAGPIQLVNESF